MLDNFEKELCEAFRFCEGLKLPQREYQGKIIYPETSQGAYFMYDNKGIYIDKTAFMITTNSNPKFLLALLNSKALTFYYKNFCGGCILGNTAYQYNKHALERFPIPQITESNQPLANEIIKCVEQILSLRGEAEAIHKQKELESKIDSLVYKLYNLTNDEIQTIQKG